MECKYETDQAKNLPRSSEETVRFETEIMDLNDYCLLKVLGYLDLLDAVNIRFICKRFNEVSQMAAYKYKEFKLHIFAREMNRLKQQISVSHFDRIINHIAPVVELIDMTRRYNSRSEGVVLPSMLLKILEKYSFPKLKILSVSNASNLKFIRNRNIEELFIETVKRGELNNYSCGITNVKKLIFCYIRKCVPISELLNFFENNPNIERVVFLHELDREIPANFFSAFKNLKMLSFRLGAHFRDVECILHIENLTELSLERRTNNAELNETVENVLTSLVRKQTVKSIELLGIYFENLVPILEQLNLDSLRFFSSSHFCDFHERFINVPFPTLKHLDIVGPIDVIGLFNLIKHLTALEEIHFTMLRSYNKDELLQQLALLLAVRRARPDLTITFLIMSLKVKIFFALGCYEMKENGRSFAAVIPHT